MVMKGQIVGLDWNRGGQLYSQVMTSTCECKVIILFNCFFRSCM